MTHEQYFAVRNMLRAGRGTDDFRRMASAYLEHRRMSTDNEMTVFMLESMGIPMEHSDGVFSIKYKGGR